MSGIPCSPLVTDDRSDLVSSRKDAGTEDLQAGIALRYRSIICLKIRLNSLLPVFQLPGEILSETFLYYKAATDEVPRPCGRRTDPLSWMRITHVCHHWRVVALDTPQLWTSFGVVGQDYHFVVELLTRSKQMPLTVHAGLYKQRDPRPVKTLLGDVHRLSSLDLELAPQMHHHLDDTPPAAAPLLRSLTLRSTQRGSHALTPLPALFNDCQLPALQELTTTGFYMTWTSNIFAPTLTRLVITCWGRYAANCAAILGVLSRMPKLEYMDLSGCVSSVPISHHEALFDHSGKPVILDKLQFLSLNTISITLTHVLDRLVIPASCKTSLCLRTLDVVTGPSLVPLSNSLASKLSGKTTIGHVSPFRTFAIWKEMPTTIILALWTDLLSVERLDPDNVDVPCPDLKIAVMLLPVTPEDVLGLCSQLLLQDVEVLSAAHGHCDLKSDTSWATLLVLLPKLTTIRLHGSDTASDLRCMLTSCDDRGCSQDYCIPELRRIVLDSVRFREAFDDSEDNGILDDLTDALQMRRDAGLGVSQVVLEKCINMGARDVERLREVAEVLWDGVERLEQSDLLRVPFRLPLMPLNGPGSAGRQDLRAHGEQREKVPRKQTHWSWF